METNQNQSEAKGLEEGALSSEEVIYSEDEGGMEAKNVGHAMNDELRYLLDS